MDTKEIFTAALQLQEPWYVREVEFKEMEDNPTEKELHITIDFKRGASFLLVDEEGKAITDERGEIKEYKAHDTVERTWRHLNFFEYRTYLHAYVPRIKDGEGHCQNVRVPWARKGSGFTLMFESFIVELAKHMSVSAIAKIVNENDKRLWNFIIYYVEKALENIDMSKVSMIGMDETSRRGHNYITVVVDLETHDVLYVTEGKDSKTVDAFVKDFKEHNGEPKNIKVITCDMSLGFKKGITENFPESQTVIDKFHVIKHINEAIDKVRKEESKTKSELKNTKYIWLKNENNLTKNQKEKKQSLSKKHLKVSRAYAMKVELQDIYEKSSSRDEAEGRLKKLRSWIMHSRIDQMKEFGNLLKNHWDDILNYFDNRFTNAVLEGTNSVIQYIKSRARGFRNIRYFKSMIFLNCSHLDLNSIFTMFSSDAWV